MARFVAGFTLAVALLGVGYSVGRAQSATGSDFELVIHGAAGDTEVKCLSGCKLDYRQTTAPADPKKGKPSVGFGCAKEQCEVFASGWVQR
jgi:hypothetical protein